MLSIAQARGRKLPGRDDWRGLPAPSAAEGGARQAVAQLRQRRAIDTGKEKAHHRIEKRDLIFGVQLRAVEKHIRDLTQNGGAPVLRDLG